MNKRLTRSQVSRGGGQVGAQEGRTPKRHRSNHDSATPANLGKYGTSALNNDEDRNNIEEDEEEEDDDDDDDDDDFRVLKEDLLGSSGTDSEQDNNARRPAPSSRRPAHSSLEDTRPRRHQQSALNTDTVQPRQPTREKLTLSNYSELGRKLGRPVLEQLLAEPTRKTNNRPPPSVLAEAQSLQGFYSSDKMSLALVGSTSLRTLESCLFEGPVSRERHGYTTWLSYSLANTIESTMPAPRQSDGFEDHNQNGRKWSKLTDSDQRIFQPKLFAQLSAACFPNLATSIDPDNTATPEQVAEYLLNFQRLVNLQKVEKHLKDGKLGNYISKSIAIIEKRGREEVGKVAVQLQSIFKRFGIHSHLLAASWNPKTKEDDPLWKGEYTTCPRWAEFATREYHLLQSFAVRSTAAVIDDEHQSGKPPNSVKPQEALRKTLSDKLNTLLRANLPRPPAKPKKDVHPKTPNPHLVIAGRKYQNVQLAVYRKPGSLVTDEMLARGAKGSQLSDKQVRLWIEDIDNERYRVVTVAEAARLASEDAQQTSEVGM